MTPASVGFQCPECVRGAAGPAGRPTRIRRTRTTVGVVTVGLVALNVAAFLVTELDAVVRGAGPLDNTRSPVWAQLAQVPLLVQLGDWWRVVTAAFMHVGLLHLVLNMVGLVVFGQQLERSLGHGRFLGVYLVSLLGGAAAVQLFADPAAPVAGASAAIYGLLGCFGVLLLVSRQSLRGIAALLAINVLLSVVVPNVSLAGHLGGLVAGAAATGAVVLARGRSWLQALALTGIGVAALLVALLAPAGALGGY